MPLNETIGGTKMKFAEIAGMECIEPNVFCFLRYSPCFRALRSKTRPMELTPLHCSKLLDLQDMTSFFGSARNIDTRINVNESSVEFRA